MADLPVQYDEEGDVLCVSDSGRPRDTEHSLDEMRLIDYSEDNGVVGVEFIDASQGSGLERRSLLQHR